MNDWGALLQRDAETLAIATSIGFGPTGQKPRNPVFAFKKSDPAAGRKRRARKRAKADRRRNRG